MVPPTRATIIELQNASSVSIVYSMKLPWKKVLFLWPTESNSGHMTTGSSGHIPCYSEATSLRECFPESHPQKGSISGVAPCWFFFFPLQDIIHGLSPMKIYSVISPKSRVHGGIVPGDLVTGLEAATTT